MSGMSLESIYGEIGRRLRESLLKVDPMTFDGMKAERIRIQTRRQVALLNLATKRWADAEIPRAYKTGARRARVALEILGKKKRKPEMEAPELRLKDKMLERAFTANNSIRETVEKFLGAAMLAAQTVRTAQVQEQIDMDEARDMFNKWGIEAVAQLQARGVLSKKIYDYLRGLIEESNFIEINGRSYNMRKYSKMVARTELREAQSESTREMCRQFDHDLVEVSVHGTTCPICAPYEGRIFSLSGHSSDYPMLDSDPPWHPNCMHSIAPVSEEALEYR
jgi:hypothetical protein